MQSQSSLTPDPQQNTCRLILASQSPRRQELLRLLGYPYTCQTVSINEENWVRPGRTDWDLPAVEKAVQELALAKAQAVWQLPHLLLPEQVVVLGCDTVLFFKGEIIGKPHDAADAIQTLQRLCGETHLVVTGFGLTDGKRTETGVVTSRVHFQPMTLEWIKRYVATGDPLDKAGSYGIQGVGAALVDYLEGDYYAVMGLPVAALFRHLHDWLQA